MYTVVTLAVSESDLRNTDFSSILLYDTSPASTKENPQ